MTLYVIHFLDFREKCDIIFYLFLTGEYSQEIPANKPWEKVSGPPILPPHLLQVILNKDTPLSVSIIFFEC